MGVEVPSEEVNARVTETIARLDAMTLEEYLGPKGAATLERWRAQSAEYGDQMSRMRLDYTAGRDVPLRENLGERECVRESSGADSLV